jgi:hypothetical protein
MLVWSSIAYSGFDTTFIDPAISNSLPSAYYYVTSQSNWILPLIS